MEDSFWVEDRERRMKANEEMAAQGLRVIGLAEGDAPISPGAWLIKEISVTSSLAYLHEEFEMAMGMMADGRVRVDPLHTATVELDQLDQVAGRIVEHDPARMLIALDAPGQIDAMGAQSGHGRVQAVDGKGHQRESRWIRVLSGAGPSLQDG